MLIGHINLVDRTIVSKSVLQRAATIEPVTMTQQVYTLLPACAGEKKRDDQLFTRKDGSPVNDFRGACLACVRSGLGKFISRKCDRVMTKKCKRGRNQRKIRRLWFHDLRRTGVRNLRRLGVAESVAMKPSGVELRSRKRQP
jgi:hypothetical protein